MPESSEDLAARVAELERENAELRSKLRERAQSRPQLELITRDEAKRSRFAKLMFAGGAVAIAGGVFAGSWLAVVLGLGWMLGGAAVASTVPESGGES